MPDAIQNVLDRIGRVATWLHDRWVIDDPTPPWVTIALTVFALALVIYPRTWTAVRHIATIVHEMGHVAMGWLWGRRVDGIRLHSDTSGLTITAGKQRGLGVLMTFLAGYPAPAAVGLALVWASVSGFSGAALTLIMALLLLAFWLIRNAFGLLLLAIALASAGAIFVTANASAVTTFTLGAGIFLLFAGTRTCLDLRHTHLNGDAENSDATMAAQHSPLPAVAWVYIFIAVSMACTVQAILVVLTPR